MKSISFYLSILTISIFCISLSKAEYNNTKLQQSLGQFLAIQDVVEFLSSTECGEYINFQYKKHNIHEEAKKYLDDQGYQEFLRVIASEQYKLSHENIVQEIKKGIAKKKTEGLSTDIMCTELIKKVKYTYDDSLNQWNSDKGWFSDKNISYNLDELKLEAKQGSVEAQYKLGLRYSRGLGIKQDFQEAKKWFSEAAMSGDAQSQTLLGVMYAHGKGIPQNYAKAIKWYQKAADQENPEAQVLLGQMYYVGNGVTPNYKKAAALFRKGAQLGDVDGQYFLGLMYAKGEGVVANGIMSYAYLSLAVDSGNLDAVEARDIVASNISEDQIKQGQKIASNIQKKIKESRK